MIKHFGRWVVALMIAVIAALWFVQRTVDEATITRGLWIIYVSSPLVSLLVVEHRRGARPSGFSIVATLLAAAVFSWILLGLEARWWIKALLLTVLSTPLMSIANARYRSDVLRAQRRRDAEATRLAQAVLAGEPVERFALYLRPFVSTDRLAAQPLPSDLRTSDVPVHLDVETLLARGFRATVPVIALGRSGDTVEGAARVTVSEANWRETVEALARRAAFITIVPLSRTGTMWELEWLKQSGLLDKVLFVMPESPHQTPDGVVSSQENDDRIFDAGVRRFEASVHMLDLPKEWLEVERVAATFGLRFPPLAAVGALYTMNPATGEVNAIVPLGLTTMPRRIRYLRASVARLLPPALAAPRDFIEDYVNAVFFGGRTLEYALVRALDGFVLWGDSAMALKLIRRASEVGKPHRKCVTGYVNSLPALIEERVTMGDDRAVARYTEFARQARTDALLPSLATEETLRQLVTTAQSKHEVTQGDTHKLG